MAALAAGLSVLAGTVAQASERSEQLVLISFDGAHDNRLWGGAWRWQTAAARVLPISCPAPS
jgi:hypothetical protein